MSDRSSSSTMLAPVDDQPLAQLLDALRWPDLDLDAVPLQNLLVVNRGDVKPDMRARCREENPGS